MCLYRDIVYLLSHPAACTESTREQCPLAPQAEALWHAASGGQTVRSSGHEGVRHSGAERIHASSAALPPTPAARPPETKANNTHARG